MSERTQRVGRNEATFRHVNERIEEINRSFALLTETMSVVCECGDATCVEQVAVGVAEYERVRSDPARFILAPGHEKPDVEEIVEQADAYIVIAKLPGEPERIAKETDPRRM